MKKIQRRQSEGDKSANHQISKSANGLREGEKSTDQQINKLASSRFYRGGSTNSLRVSFTLLLLIVALLPTSAQRTLNVVKLDSEPVAVSIDRPGDLYLVLRDGRVVRVDAEGATQPIDAANPSPTLFDPRDGARLFAYYRASQQYSYFGASADVQWHPVDSAFAIEPWLVCPSGDYNLWIADRADNTLRKVSTATARIDAEIPFADNIELIRSMREYQGFLFVHHKTRGLLVYSAMGRLLRTFGDGTIPYFNFLGEELYYPQSDKLTFINLFNLEKRTVASPRPTSMVLFTDARQYIVGGNVVEIMAAR